MGLSVVTLGMAKANAARLQPELRVKFFGHSYVEGRTGVSRISNRFSTVLCGLLGAREENYGWHGAATKYTQVGSSPWLNNVPPRAAPFGSATQAAMIYTGINEVGGSDLASDPDLSVAWIRCMVHWLRAQQRMSVVDSSYIVLAKAAGAAAWAQSSLAYGPYGDEWTGRDGNTITITTPATFPGGSLRIWFDTQPNVGAVHTVTLNGAAAGAKDTRGATVATVKPAFVEVTGIPAGVNTIVDTLSSSATNGERFMYAEYAAAVPPPVIVANINRCPSYAANGGVATDAGVAAQNVKLAAMAAEFTDGRVILLDVDSVLAKDSANFASDGLHPNDQGNRKIAVAAATALRPLLRDGDPATSLGAGPESMYRVRVDQSTRGNNGVSQAPAGIATLAAGTVTVSTRAIESTSDLVIVTRQSGSSTGSLGIAAKVATSGATTGSFTITSSDAADTGTVGWMVVNAAT